MLVLMRTRVRRCMRKCLVIKLRLVRRIVRNSLL